MSITASAPGRIDLSGGATDWCGMHTLSMAINLRAYAKVKKHNDPKMIKLTVGTLVDEYSIPSYDGSDLDLFKAALELTELTGFEIEFWTEIPRASGMGGSAPLNVAGIFALKQLFNKKWSRYYIAELAQRAETLKLQTVQGYQDHYSAAFGGINFMDFNGKECQRDQYSKPIDKEPYAVVENLGEFYPDFHIIAAFPQIDRESSDSTNGSLSDRYLNGEKEIVDSIKLKAKLTQDAKKALVDGEINELYSLINQNNEIMKSWGFLSKYNLELLNQAKASGALAVKTCGAGRAGMAIFARDDKHRSELFTKLKPFTKNIYKVELDNGVRLEK